MSTSVGDVAVHVSGDGPPVLLVHGLPGSAAVWQPVTDRLVALGFRTVVPDLLGFGGSDRPQRLEGLWLEAQATAVEELLAGLGTGPVVAVGHDYGAPVSVTLADRAPHAVTGLVLAAGNLFTDTPIPYPLRLVTVPGLGRVVGGALLSDPMLRVMLRMGVGRPRVSLPAGAYLGDAGQRRTIRTILGGALRGLEDRYRGAEAAMARLAPPAVVVWGDRDPIFSVEQARRTAAAIPAATVRIEPGAGHFLPAERPGALADAVQQLHRPDRPPAVPSQGRPPARWARGRGERGR